MKLNKLLLPIAAVGIAGFLVVPSTSTAYSLLGWTLAPNQRDLRVFNNFTDALANNNQTAHPMFPGWFGADMALWKGAIEWGSRLHGDGSGDDGQPNGLGSGGANFDPSWQGRALSHGSVGQNIQAEISGCNGGVLAFTESFTNGSGWRISYYQCWTWVDGPSINWPQGNGKFDLQGVGTHEYGHATGMGHSTNNNATMRPGASNGKLERSLHSDDIAGIQANYGVHGANKPIINSYTVSGNTVTVVGTKFSLGNNNELWFTRDGTGNGTPVKATNLQSSNSGTVVSATIPGTAGPGDILLKAGPGGGVTLSNAYPFDPTSSGGCAPPTNYCVTSPNSVGSGALIGTLGSQSIGTNDFELFATGAIPNEFGLFFYSDTQAQVPAGNGFLCLGGTLFRLPAVQCDFLGTANYQVDFNNLPTNGDILSGDTKNFSFWYRDPSIGAGYSFSDGVEVEFCD